MRLIPVLIVLLTSFSRGDIVRTSVCGATNGVHLAAVLEPASPPSEEKKTPTAPNAPPTELNSIEDPRLDKMDNPWRAQVDLQRKFLLKRHPLNPGAPESGFFAYTRFANCEGAQFDDYAGHAVSVPIGNEIPGTGWVLQDVQSVDKPRPDWYVIVSEKSSGRRAKMWLHIEYPMKGFGIILPQSVWARHSTEPLAKRLFDAEILHVVDDPAPPKNRADIDLTGFTSVEDARFDKADNPQQDQLELQRQFLLNHKPFAPTTTEADFFFFAPDDHGNAAQFDDLTGHAVSVRVGNGIPGTGWVLDGVVRVDMPCLDWFVVLSEATSHKKVKMWQHIKYPAKGSSIDLPESVWQRHANEPLAKRLRDADMLHIVDDPKEKK